MSERPVTPIRDGSAYGRPPAHFNKTLIEVGPGTACGELMRRTAWSATPLGSSRGWPRTLRTLVPIMLASRFAMRLLWGPEMILLYNDRYRPVLGPRKHPQAMGRPIEESYRELWQTMGSTHRMFVWCNEAVRAEPYALGSQEYVDLELYERWRARGLPIETPAVRR